MCVFGDPAKSVSKAHCGMGAAFPLLRITARRARHAGFLLRSGLAELPWGGVVPPFGSAPPDLSVQDALFPCGRCTSAEYVNTRCQGPKRQEHGTLTIRRPTPADMDRVEGTIGRMTDFFVGVWGVAAQVTRCLHFCTISGFPIT